MKTKPIMFVLCLAGLCYARIPEREWISEYDESFPIRLSQENAETRLDALEREISSADSIGNYPIAKAFDIDLELKKIQNGQIPPTIYYDHGFLAYGDEASECNMAYWRSWNLETKSADTRKRWSNSAEEAAEYERLTRATKEARTLWFPELRTRVKTRYLTELIASRAFLAVLLAFVCFCGKSFNRRILKAACYFVSLCLSAFASPVMATQIAKPKKKEKQKIEAVLDNIAPVPQAASPPRPNIMVDTLVFGDFTHDWQEHEQVTINLWQKTSLVFANQNRQAASNGPKLFSLAAAGLRFKPRPPLTFQVFGGPQHSWEKGRVDQISAFATVSYKGERAEATLINRFSWGLDGKVPFANRHVVITSIPRVPRWLAVEAEIRRANNGVDENFWGPLVRVGRLFRKGWPKQILGGLHLYPHFDFIKSNWDLRFGISYASAK